MRRVETAQRSIPFNAINPVLTVAGARLIEVLSEADVRDSVNERTAMMFFLKPTHRGDNISPDGVEFEVNLTFGE